MKLPKVLSGFAIGGAACFLLANAVPPGAGPIEHLTIGPETTVVSDPLNDVGYPDYVSVLNAEQSRDVAPEENFWTLCDTIVPLESGGDAYLKGISLQPGFSGVLENERRFISFPSPRFFDEHTPETTAFRAEYDTAIRGPWRPDELERVADWLARNEEPLKVVTTAALRNKAYAPNVSTSPSGSLIELSIPHVQCMIGVAKALDARAMRHLGEQRPDDAWQDVLTACRIGRHLNESQFVVGRLTAIMLREIGRDSAAHCAAHTKWTTEDVQARWRELEPLLQVPAVGEELRGERFLALSYVLGLYSGTLTFQELSGVDDGGDKTPGIESRLRKGDVDATLKECNRVHDRLLEALARPTLRERETALIAALEEMKVGELTRAPIPSSSSLIFGGIQPLEDYVRSSAVVILSSNYPRMSQAHARDVANVELIHAALAAELFRRSGGKDVADGAELSAAGREAATAVGLARVPELVDPYTGAELNVRREADALVIFCVGPDGKASGGGYEAEDNVEIRLPR